MFIPKALATRCGSRGGATRTMTGWLELEVVNSKVNFIKDRF